MPSDFTIDGQIERCRQKLIEKLTPDLAAGNCYSTIASTPVAAFGRLHVQLFDDGGTYQDAGGGLMKIHWTLGVAVRNVLMVDQVDKFIAASKDLRTFGRRVRNVIHLFYDGNYFPQPPFVVSHSPARKEVGERGEHVIELRFRMLSLERYSAIKA